jgi:lipoyl(octanoyl) transferase
MLEQAVSPSNVFLNVYLLGTVDFEDVLSLQRRLVYEVASEPDQAVLVVCEHPPLITVGRQGSREHIQFEPAELDRRGWAVRWVNRGGGCLFHAPGQFAVYPILPLDRMGLGIAEYLDRLQATLLEVALDSGAHAQRRPGQPGVWSGNRLLAHVGVAVRGWVSYFGAALNVNPCLEPFRKVHCGGSDLPMTSLERERKLRIDPSMVRQRVVERFMERFSLERVAVYFGHPQLPGKADRYAVVAPRR